MGRKQKKCIKKCQNHLFHLRPFHSMAYISRDVQVSFCPASLEKPPNYPSFNKDRKYYTSSFYLKDQMPPVERNDETCKKDHHQFCLDQQKEKSQMFEPKPRSKNSYCYVCKSHYEDYYKHVKSDGHKASIRRNKFSQHIQTLIRERYPPRIPSIKEQQPELPPAITEQKLISSSSTISQEPKPIKFFSPQNNFSSFRPFNTMGAFQMARVESFKQIVSLDLAQNKAINTPEDQPKKSEEYMKKSPSSTKIHHPIILNCPFVIS